MLYEVVNKPKKVDYELLDNLLSFGSEYLCLEEDIYMIIKFINNMEPHVHGYCLYEHDEVCLEINSKLSTEDIMRTIFHELVHVKQYETGDLLFDGKSSYWKNMKHDKTDYYTQPWELEAYQLEKDMFEKYSLTF